MAKRDKKKGTLTAVVGGGDAGASSAAGSGSAAPGSVPGSGSAAPITGKATSDPRLIAAMDTFKRGDYVRARVLFAPLVNDPSLSEGERKMAAARLEATRLDRVIPKTALAGLALITLAVILTSFIQP